MKQSKPKLITLQEVAKHSGVSQTTASLAIRGKSNISEATRQRVFASMQELGYVYDRGAANLRSRASSSTVGLILPDLSNPFYTELLIGIHQELNRCGQTVILGTTFESESIQDRLLSTILEHRVAGIIFFVVPGSHYQSVERIRRLGIPVVLVNRNLPEINCDYVGIDNLTGGYRGVEHLVSKGHRRIGFLGGVSQLSSYQGRKQGYVNGLQAAGLDVDDSLIIEGPMTRDSGSVLIEKALTHPNPPTAIFCYNDTIAIGAMVRMKELGLRPGHDLAIIGCDDIPEGSIFSPRLTTMSSFPQILGANAVRLLHARIEGLCTEPQSVILRPELIIRESCSYHALP
jgi:LacI family transcriptional regulator